MIGEEFGLIACLAIATLYLRIVARVLIKLLDEDLGSPSSPPPASPPVRAAGADQHDGQRPARPVEGHDLAVHQLRRIIDAGAVDRDGLLLAFTRRNPYLTRSPYVVKWGGEQLTT